MTLISQQMLVGNYTNCELLVTLLTLPAIKRPDSLDVDIQESINKIKARCKQQETGQYCQHALTLKGLLYLFGVGYPQKEYANAMSCFEKAMSFNNSYAINYRGYMDMHGLRLGNVKFPGEAIRLFKKAIKLGNPFAMNNLALFYEQLGGTINLYHDFQVASQMGFRINQIIIFFWLINAACLSHRIHPLIRIVMAQTAV